VSLQIGADTDHRRDDGDTGQLLHHNPHNTPLLENRASAAALVNRRLNLEGLPLASGHPPVERGPIADRTGVPDQAQLSPDAGWVFRAEG